MATIIHADGTAETFTGSGKRGKLTLEEAQKAVGGYIELVPYKLQKGIVMLQGKGDKTVVVEITGRTKMVCNEEGKCEGKPINPVATILVNRVDMIAGDVLLCGPGEL